MKVKTRGGANRKENSIAWGTAIGIHAALLLLFAFLNVGWRYDLPEWIEMEVLSLKPTPSRPAQAPPQKEIAATTPARKPERVINLPKRRMLEDELPTLRAERSKDMPAPDDVSDRAIEAGYRAQRPEAELPRPEYSNRDKAAADLGRLEIGERTIRAMPQDLGKGVDVPFQIEGEAAERTVVQKVIPEYPSGLAREAVVKISFVVLPGGVVARALPILKGDADLEKIAIEAFRQWRFNPLPADVEQREQQGVITFRFILR